MIVFRSVEAVAQSKTDSTFAFDWSVIYRNRLDILFSSGVFPWNDEEAESHLNDRLALLVDYRPVRQCDLFLKVATGYRGESGVSYENWVVFEQGHAGFRFGENILAGRFFLREKIYRTNNKLLPIVSNDAPFIGGRGEGVHAEIGNHSKALLSFTGSMLRDYAGGFGSYPYFPGFNGGGDMYNLLHGSYAAGVGWLGFLMSETRSIPYGDAVMVGADIGLKLKGMHLVAELARTSSGRWEDLRSGSFFGIDLRDFEFGEFNKIFSKDNAFSAELLGLTVRRNEFGSLGFIPGYRFYGEEFINPQGEIVEGLIKTYGTLWWKHYAYDVHFSVDAADVRREDSDLDYGLLYQMLRLRFKGDLEIKESVFFREKSRGSVVLSLIDENPKTRLVTSARLDDLGGENDLSFFAEGGMNIGKAWTFTTALYLHKSVESFYYVGMEFRPGKRFLFGTSLGSFDFRQQDILLNRRYDVPEPREEKRVLIYARIWLGDI